MLTTTTTITRAVEHHTVHPAGTVLDIIGGTYEGHIGRVKRYTAQRVVIKLYTALGRAGSKTTLNKEVTIKASNTKARALETESTPDDETSLKNSNIKARKFDIASDDESLFLLASLVASQIKRQPADFTTGIKNSFFKRVNKLLEGAHPE
jgi:hypothetical protein